MRRWQQALWQRRSILAIAPTLAIAVIALRAIGLLQAWEWAAYDQYMRLRPTESTDERIVIVGIDETDLVNIGQPIVPDGVYAKLIRKLRSQSPSAIGLDIYRDLPVEPGHQQLVEVFQTTPHLIGIQKVVGEPGKDTVPPPPALAELGQVSANDIITDADNTVRRGLLSTQAANGETVYSLSLYLALLYLEPQGIGPEMTSADSWQLGKTHFTPFAQNDGGYSRADARGYQQIINYRGDRQTFETVSLTDVLNNSVPSDWATDKIVLIGAVGESFQDTGYTPYSSTLLSLPRTMNGVEIHANLTSQIISAALDNRPLMQSWSEPVEWIWILLWSGTGAWLVWSSGQTDSSRKKRVSIWQTGTFSISLAIAVLLGITFISFCFSWWIPLVPPALAATGAAISVTVHTAYRAGVIRRTFGRYLSDEIVTTLLENPEGQKLGGDRREITILTSDLRGFTVISEQLPPETVIKILNFYLGKMSAVIIKHGGTIDEFMGDGILVLFGAPNKRDDDAIRAIACAVEMQLAMSEVNKTMADWGLSEIEMGIGIHTGEVVVGNIGSLQRTKYGVVGSPVNLTYRIESFTIGGQILTSEATLNAAGPAVEVADSQAVYPKGVADPITIYDIASVGAPYHLALEKPKESFYFLEQPMLVRLKLVKEKQIANSTFVAQIVALSEKGALIDTEAEVVETAQPLSNLKLNFLSLQGTLTTQDIYAKVTQKVDEKNQLYIHFTSVPPAIDQHLEALRKDVQSRATLSRAFPN